MRNDLADNASYGYGPKLDVFGGGSSMLIEPDHHRHDPNIARSFAHPLVVHFCGSHVQRHPYPTLALKLERAISAGWPHRLAPAYAGRACTLPANAIQSAEDLLFPVYRMLFGCCHVVD